MIQAMKGCNTDRCRTVIIRSMLRCSCHCFEGGGLGFAREDVVRMRCAILYVGAFSLGTCKVYPIRQD